MQIPPFDLTLATAALKGAQAASTETIPTDANNDDSGDGLFGDVLAEALAAAGLCNPPVVEPQSSSVTLPMEATGAAPGLVSLAPLAGQTQGSPAEVASFLLESPSASQPATIDAATFDLSTSSEPRGHNTDPGIAFADGKSIDGIPTAPMPFPSPAEASTATQPNTGLDAIPIDAGKWEPLFESPISANGLIATPTGPRTLAEPGVLPKVSVPVDVESAMSAPDLSRAMTEPIDGSILSSRNIAEEAGSIAETLTQEAGVKPVHVAKVEPVTESVDTELRADSTLPAEVVARPLQLDTTFSPGVQALSTQVDQIGEAILNRHDEIQRSGKAEIHLRLDPPELGSVQIHLHGDDQHLTGRIVAAEQTTHALLETQMESLRHRLEQAGYQVSRFEVSWQGSGRSDLGGHHAQQHHELPQFFSPRMARSAVFASAAAGTGSVNILA